MFGIVSDIIGAIKAAGIPCGEEFGREYGFGKKGVYAVAGMKKLRLPYENNGVSSAEVRVIVYAPHSDGNTVTEATKKILNAMHGFGGQIYSAEISEMNYDPKVDTVYCNIILGVGDFTAVSFGGITLYAEEYSVSRSAASGETVLITGDPSVYVGGTKAARIRLTGYAEEKSAAKLDALLSSGEKFSLAAGGAVFPDAFLSEYSCGGKCGYSEKVTAEFICENGAEPAETEAV
ncbi:MAG: hypothetical protein J6C96_09695 [Oscillospiraceae bacterium]|nr:hypothetical protein [Oscillospiraceae bacterium]